MKKKLAIMLVLVLLFCLVGCAKTPNTPTEPETESTQEMAPIETDGASETGPIETEPAESNFVYPLPTTIDLHNLDDCALHVEIQNGDIFLKHNSALTWLMRVKVYEYELFDSGEVASLDIGKVLVVNRKQVEITEIGRNELGTVIINGGLDNGGYELVTNEDGVYYSIGYSDTKTYYEIGEIILDVSPDFVYIDKSDLDSGEASYAFNDMIAGEGSVNYSGTPNDTTIVVEDGIVVSMIRTYAP